MRADQYIGVSSEYTYANFSESAIKAKISQAQQAEQDARRSLLSLEETFKQWNDEVDKKVKAIAALESKITEAQTEKSRLNSVRYNQGSSSQRASGEGCKKSFGLAGAWDGGCLTRNTQRQNAQQQIVDDSQAQINKLSKEVDAARTKALAAQREMTPTRERISKAQADVTRALAELEQGKALNNTEALKARAELQEATRKRETELQQKMNELEQLKNQAAAKAHEAALKDALIEQESGALQASADLQKSSMPMVVGFIGLVILSFIIQPMLKKKD